MGGSVKSKAKVANPDAFYGVITSAIKNSASDPTLVDTIVKNAQQSLGKSIQQLFKEGEFVPAFEALSQAIIKQSGYEVEKVALSLVKELEASAVKASGLMVDATGDKLEQVLLNIIDSSLLKMDTIGLHLITAVLEKGSALGQELCELIIEDLRELVVLGGEEVSKLLSMVATYSEATGKELLTELFKLLQGSSEQVVNNTLVPAIITCTQAMGSEVLQIVEACSQQLDKQLQGVIRSAFKELKTFTKDEFNQVQEKLIEQLAANMHSLVEHFSKNLEEIAIHSINQAEQSATDFVSKMSKKFKGEIASQRIAEVAAEAAIHFYLEKQQINHHTKIHQEFQLTDSSLQSIKQLLTRFVNKSLRFDEILPNYTASSEFSNLFISLFAGKIAITLEKLLSNDFNKNSSPAFILEPPKVSPSYKQEAVFDINLWELKYNKNQSEIYSIDVYKALSETIIDAYKNFERIQRGDSIFEVSQQEHKYGMYITKRLLGLQEEISVLYNQLSTLSTINQQQAEQLADLSLENTQNQQTITELALENAELKKQFSQLLTFSKQHSSETLALIPKVTIRLEQGRLSYYKNFKKVHELDLTKVFSAEAQLIVKDLGCIVWDSNTIFYFKIAEDRLQRFQCCFKISKQIIEQAVMLDEQKIMVALADGTVRYWQYNEPVNKPVKSKQKQWSSNIFKPTQQDSSMAIDTLKLSETSLAFNRILDDFHLAEKNNDKTTLNL